MHNQFLGHSGSCMMGSHHGSLSGRGAKQKKVPSDHCVCGKCSGNTVTTDDRAVLCFICCCSLLAECLGMSDEAYEFTRHSSCCLIVCELCQSEGVLVSDRQKKVEEKVDKLTECALLLTMMMSTNHCSLLQRKLMVRVAVAKPDIQRSLSLRSLLQSPVWPKSLHILSDKL